MRSLVDEARRIGLTDEQIARATVNGKPLAEYDGPRKRSDRWGKFKSKWELLYSLELEDQKRAGMVLDWWYEPMRFELVEPSKDATGKTVKGIFYKPDFLIRYMARPAPLRFVEVKGYRRTKDINRFKLARDKFPCFEWVMVSRTKTGWEVVM